jgi:hypothetical protein
LIQSGVPALDAPLLLAEYNKIVLGGSGMAVAIREDGNITIDHIHTGLDICGGAVILRLYLAKLYRSSCCDMCYSNE